jgi:hypothetical protein
MATVIHFLLGLAMLAAAAATEIEPPELLIKGNAGLMHEGSEHRVLRQVDLASIRRKDPAWTEARLKALFRSIDPEKIRYADDDGDRIKTEVTMTEPLKIRFTFEARHNKAAERNAIIPHTTYWLIGVQLLENQEAPQGGAGQAAPAPEPKRDGNEKSKPDQ